MYFKRILAIALSLGMVLTMAPTSMTAYAAEVEEQPVVEEQEAEQAEAETETEETEAQDQKEAKVSTQADEKEYKAEASFDCDTYEEGDLVFMYVDIAEVDGDTSKSVDDPESLGFTFKWYEADSSYEKTSEEISDDNYYVIQKASKKNPYYVCQVNREIKDADGNVTETQDYGLIKLKVPFEDEALTAYIYNDNADMTDDGDYAIFSTETLPLKIEFENMDQHEFELTSVDWVTEVKAGKEADPNYVFASKPGEKDTTVTVDGKKLNKSAEIKKNDGVYVGAYVTGVLDGKKTTLPVASVFVGLKKTSETVYLDIEDGQDLYLNNPWDIERMNEGGFEVCDSHDPQGRYYNYEIVSIKSSKTSVVKINSSSARYIEVIPKSLGKAKLTFTYRVQDETKVRTKAITVNVLKSGYYVDVQSPDYILNGQTLSLKAKVLDPITDKVVTGETFKYKWTSSDFKITNPTKATCKIKAKAGYEAGDAGEYTVTVTDKKGSVVGTYDGVLELKDEYYTISTDLETTGDEFFAGEEATYKPVVTRHYAKGSTETIDLSKGDYVLSFEYDDDSVNVTDQGDGTYKLGLKNDTDLAGNQYDVVTAMLYKSDDTENALETAAIELDCDGVKDAAGNVYYPVYISKNADENGNPALDVALDGDVYGGDEGWKTETEDGVYAFIKDGSSFKVGLTSVDSAYKVALVYAENTEDLEAGEESKATNVGPEDDGAYLFNVDGCGLYIGSDIRPAFDKVDDNTLELADGRKAYKLTIKKTDSFTYDSSRYTWFLDDDGMAQFIALYNDETKGLDYYLLDGEEYYLFANVPKVSCDPYFTSTSGDTDGQNASYDLKSDRNGLTAGTSIVFSINEPTTLNLNYICKTHTWQKKYTVDLEPTCIATGRKSIHCSVCHATKSVKTIAKLKATIKLSAKKATVAKNATYDLKISNLGLDDYVTSVKSSKTSVATVSYNDGVATITGVKAGTATITVKLKSGKTDTCKVTVK